MNSIELQRIRNAKLKGRKITHDGGVLLFDKKEYAKEYYLKHFTWVVIV